MESLNSYCPKLNRESQSLPGAGQIPSHRQLETTTLNCQSFCLRTTSDRIVGLFILWATESSSLGKLK